MATSISLGRHQPLHVEVRHVSALQSLAWLRRGWNDLGHFRSASLGQGAMIAVLGAVLLILFSSHAYLFAAAVTGYLLVGPIMTTELCELSRRRELSQPDAEESQQPRDARSLFRFGAILGALAVIWFIASATMLQTVLHAAAPSLGVALWGSFTDAVSRPELMGYIVSGAVLAAIVFSLSVVAVPLIIDRHARATDAMWASIRVTFANLPAMLVWAGLIVAVTALGFITLLIGMVVVAPLLGHATWHAYRDLVR
ncbi:MAG TPA: DUF2189 domain-containing protein [Steroidobacteraceae bacterium]